MDDTVKAPALVVVTNEEQRRTPPDDDWVKSTCKIGQGAKCCCFLTAGAHGWSCEKGTAMGITLALRSSLGMMSAKSDNCEGRAAQ
jgi:hypothetical protein